MLYLLLKKTGAENADDNVSCVLTTPVSVDQVDNDLAIECLIERPYQQVSQQHQEADNETADDKDVTKDERKDV